MPTLSYLSPAQFAHWRRHGYLVLERFASPEACDQLAARAAQLSAELAHERDQAVFSTTEQEHNSNAYFLSSGDKIRIFMEETDQKVVNKLGHALHNQDPVFRAFSYQENLFKVAADIGFSAPEIIQSMYIFKHPRVGGEVSAHQDSSFLYTEPRSCVGFWFAIEDATVENACLWVLPAGQHEVLRTRFVRDGHGGVAFRELDARPLPTEGYVPVEVPKGSLVIFHGNLPHYSEVNWSPRPRQAFTLHFIERDAVYPAENWLQRGE